MKLMDMEFDGKDLRDLAIGVICGFMQVLVVMDTEDLGAAILIGLVFGASGGVVGGLVVCSMRRNRNQSPRRSKTS